MHNLIVKKKVKIDFSHLRKIVDVGRRVRVGWGGVEGGFSLLIVESSVPQCSEMANC